MRLMEHISFHHKLPWPAMESGADLCVQVPIRHPALTQSSLLHVSSEVVVAP